MVTDQYSHILDDDRKNNAALFEKAFYSGKGSDSIEAPAETGSEAKQPLQVWTLTFWQRYSVIRKWQRC